MKEGAKYKSWILLVLVASYVSAQNFKQDYKQTTEAYNSLNKFYCEVKINMYETRASLKPAQVISSVIKKQGEDFWYAMGKTKMVVNDRCVLYIDEDSRKMIYAVRDKKNEMKLPQQNPVAMIDSLVNKSDSIVYAGVKNNCRRYIIYAAHSLITKTEIAINQNNYFIESITYFYNPKKSSSVAKVVIEYAKFDTAPQYTESDFSENQYAVFSKNTLKPLNAYANYQTSIIDQNDLE